MTIIYTGTPPVIKVNGISFTQGQPVDVPAELGVLLLKKPFFIPLSAPDPEPDQDEPTELKPKRRT